MSNWIPEAFIGIKRNFEVGNLKRAAELQRLVCDVLAAYEFEEIASTKALMEYRGFAVGDPWAPLLPMPDEMKRALFRRMDAFHLDFDVLAASSAPAKAAPRA